MMPPVGADAQRALLRTMLLMRRTEEALIALTKEHAVGHFHVYIGQEATGAPALALLEPGDHTYTTHRNHGHLIGRGGDPARVLAEILGRSTGYNHGRGGTLHIASLALGFPATSASVGGCLPIAVGSAFAFKELKRPNVSMALFGDGALEEGAFAESINIAAIRQLPVIFLCENNSLEALGQKAGEYPSSTLAARELTDLAKPYRVPAVAVDGTDVGAVHAAVAEAIARARSGGGPTFIEARTVRWPGSRPLWPTLVTGETDIARAWDASRISGEYAEWYRTQDGLLRFIRESLAARTIDEPAVLALDADIHAQVASAVRFALDSPYPAADDVERGVFA